MNDDDLRLDIPAGGLARSLSYVLAFLIAAHLVSRVLVFGFGVPTRSFRATVFDLGSKQNVPGLFLATTMFVSAALLAAAGTGERRRGRPAGPWWVLSGVFFFFSFDEWFAIHDAFIIPMRHSLHASGVFYYAWVIPYLAFAAAFGLYQIPFLLRLPARTRWLFLLSGAIFVGGAAGCEMIGAVIDQRMGRDNLLYAAEVLAEETMERAGIVLFIHAIVDYIRRELPGLTLRVGFASAANTHALIRPLPRSSYTTPDPAKFKTPPAP